MDASHRPGAQANRRRYPRLEVLDQIEGELVPLDVPVTLRDLSHGGFSIVSSNPFPPGTMHHFRFTAAVDAVVLLDATAVHCRLTSASASGEFSYITGFEFVSAEHTEDAIAVLLDTLASMLSLD